MLSDHVVTNWSGQSLSSVYILCKPLKLSQPAVNIYITGLASQTGAVHNVSLTEGNGFPSGRPALYKLENRTDDCMYSQGVLSW